METAGSLVCPSTPKEPRAHGPLGPGENEGPGTHGLILPKARDHGPRALGLMDLFGIIGWGGLGPHEPPCIHLLCPLLAGQPSRFGPGLSNTWPGLASLGQKEFPWFE